MKGLIRIDVRHLEGLFARKVSDTYKAKWANRCRIPVTNGVGYKQKSFF